MSAPSTLHVPVFTRLDHLGLIVASGADARDFLHAQLTGDVASLAPQASLYAGYCTAKGRLLATFLLWRREQDFWLQVPGELREAAQKQLTRYILRARVTMADASGDYVRIGVSGAGAAELLDEIFGSAPAAPFGVLHAAQATVIKLPVERYELVVAAAHAPAIQDALARHARAGAPEDWNWLDVRAGLPTITSRTQEEFVPQMVNLDLLGGVSFTKGCYPGQEIVARMHYLGRLKQRMYLVHIAAGGMPEPGEKLYSAGFGDQACGMIVGAASAPGGGYDALAVMQIDEARNDNVHWLAADGPVIELLDQPYPISVTSISR